MDITIRQLQGDELLETLYTLNSYALHPSPPYQNKEEWLDVVRERQEKNCHALFEKGTGLHCGWHADDAKHARQIVSCLRDMGSIHSPFCTEKRLLPKNNG